MLYERLDMMRAALTRTTRRLGLVSYGEPPGGLPAALGRPSGQRMEGRL